MKKTFLFSAMALALCNALAVQAAPAAPAAAAAAASHSGALVRHVLLISVDGLHEQDLRRFVRQHPRSTLANLEKQGITYRQAFVGIPADSFPGTLGMLTGGTPAVTGVYYDDSYDRALSAPGSDCSVTGTRVAYDESIDKPTADAPDAIDPNKLPRDPGKQCAPVWPHDYLRVNTAFDVIKAAGGHTAWIDKHPSYDIVNGPSGNGVDDLYTPEIGANYEALSGVTVSGVTASLSKTEAYDNAKALAILNEIDGFRHDRSAKAPTPALFGMNMQVVNVAQKLYGYRNAEGALTPGVEEAIGYADGLLGRFVDALRRTGQWDDTLLIVTAKHGNGPIDPKRLRHVDKGRLKAVVTQAAPNALGQLTVDNGALIWLKDAGKTDAVVHALLAEKAALGIQDVLSGSRLLQRFGLQQADDRSPEIEIVSQAGVIYTSPDDKKRAEHGGVRDYDRHVALLLSNPHLRNAGKVVDTRVTSTQIAPTVLESLGLSPDRLDAVARQHTAVLPASAMQGDATAVAQ